MHKFKSSLAVLAAAIMLPAVAQAQTKITIGIPTSPPNIVHMPTIVAKELGHYKKAGLDVDIVSLGDGVKVYRALLAGNIEFGLTPGAPTIIGRSNGAAVKALSANLPKFEASMVVRADIKSLADLKGKQLAVDMGGSQFQVTKMYLAAKGIDLGKDIIVVNANFAVARAQLEADRVDAALVIEPLASIILKQNPNWKVIFNGAQGWKEITGQDGWEIVTAMRGDAIAKNPNGPKMLIAALQDVAQFMQTNTAEADKIANETLKLPPGILTAALASKRLQMVIQPAWEPATRKTITDMMERAVKAGFYEKMPDEKIIYAP